MKIARFLNPMLPIWGYDYFVKQKNQTMVPYGDRYCKKYSGYSRHRTSNLDECKEKCLNDDTCDAMALKFWIA